MSDDLIIHEENGREYHSAFDLELDSLTIETIKWLVLGHLLYLAGLAFAVLLRIEMGNVWMTPLFVLPLLWAERKQVSWMRALVFVIGFTAIHYAAVALASNAYPDSIRAGGNAMLPGAIGGAVGAFGSLALCALLGMLKPGAPNLIFAAFGGLLLTGVGSFGVYMYLTSGGAGDGFAGTFLNLLWVYSPWQLLFAYVLAKTLKPVEA